MVGPLLGLLGADARLLQQIVGYMATHHLGLQAQSGNNVDEEVEEEDIPEGDFERKKVGHSISRLFWEREWGGSSGWCVCLRGMGGGDGEREGWEE